MEKPPKPCPKRPLTWTKGIVFTVVKVGILVFLIMLCAGLKRLGKLHEGECIWVQDLCGVITNVSVALLKGYPVEPFVIQPKEREKTAEVDPVISSR